MQNWRLELTNLNYVPMGEILNAAERKVTIALNKLDTCAFRMRMDNPLAELIATTAGFVKAWRNGVLVFYGPVITAEENGQSGSATLSVNCQSGGWLMLNKRYANQSVTPDAGKRVDIDRAIIVKNEMAATNTNQGETGVSTTAMAISAAETVNYTIPGYTPMVDLLRTMHTGDNTFDWRMVPMDNWDNGVVTSLKHTAFTAAPVLGQTRPEAIWEFGTGRANLQSYRNFVSRETQISEALSLISSTKVDTSFVSTGLNWGVMQDIVSNNEISDESQAAALRSAHLNVRMNPRRITTWQPHIDPSGLRMPEYGIDYVVGDIVHGRGVVDNIVRFDGLFRCWAVDFAIDDNGFERANLILQESEA